MSERLTKCPRCGCEHRDEEFEQLLTEPAYVSHQRELLREALASGPPRAMTEADWAELDAIAEGKEPDAPLDPGHLAQARRLLAVLELLAASTQPDTLDRAMLVASLEELLPAKRGSA